MNRAPLILLFVFAASWSGLAGAAITAYPFDDPAKAQRFKALTEQLRCLVCQNQSLAESNAGLADDLKRQTYEMIQDGRSDQEIVDFMVTRYGDFILYRPPLKPGTLLLWAGPLLLLVVGVAVLVVLIRQWGRGTQPSQLSEAERRRLDEVLKRTEERTR